MHKTSIHFLRRFDLERSSSGNTRLETCFRVSPVLYFLKKTPHRYIYVSEKFISHLEYDEFEYDEYDEFEYVEYDE